MRSERNMLAIFLALGGAVAGAVIALNLPGNAWDTINNPPEKFSPGPAGVVAWIAAIAAVVAFGIVGVSHAMVKAKHDAWKAEVPTLEPAKPKPYQDRRAEDLVADYKYQEFKRIRVREKDDSMKEYRVLALPPQKGKDGIETRDVVLVGKEPEDESAFTFSLLFDDFAWRKGSAWLFQGPERKGIAIHEAMQDDYLRAGVGRARHIVCIGLASNEISTMAEEDNEKLSDARGMNLCKALFRMGYITEGVHTAVSAGGGFATNELVVDPVRQRTAIVIGVRYGKELSVGPFVLAMNELLSVKGVNLEEYSRAPADFKTTDPIEPGPYVAIDEVVWDARQSDVIVPNIPKPPEKEQ